MESISHSLPKRSFSSNSNGVFTSQKSVYDDVFGGPPKFGIPTLAPRLEDYSEIFGGFHASRSSSIPVLHLPLIAAAADNLHLDVRSPGFDYTEVFGDFGGLDFTASFDDLVGQSSGGYDSSDEPWSPAQSGSLSDELDPPNGSDNRLSDGDAHQSLASIKHFNASYNKSIQGNVGAMLTGTAHVADYSAVPGDTFPSYESSVSWNGEDDQCSMHVIDDINCSKEFGERIKEEKPFKKCLSYPLHSGFNTLVNDFSPFEKHGNSISPQDKPFITVSDISLQTKPSRLPPPSRPPPALVVKKGECGRSSSKLKASKSYAFDRVVDDSASLFFDVEVDASVSAEGRKNGNKNIKVMHESTQESIERKDIRSPNAVQVEEKTDKIVRASCNTEDDKMHRSHGKETSVSVPVIGDRMGSTKSTKETLGFRRVGYCNHIADNSAEAVARKEATEYFEVNEKDDSDKAFYMVEDYDTSTQMHQDACRHRRRADLDTLNPREDSEKLEVTKETPKWDEASNQCEMTGNYCDWGNKQQKEMQNTSLIDRKRFLEKIKLNKQTCVYDLKVMIPENTQQLGESEKLQIDNSEIAEGLNESKGRVRDVEAKLRLKASPKRMDIKKNSVDAQVIKRNGGKHKKNILMEECQRGLEDVRGAETRERVQETTESEGIEKQHCVPGKENESKLKDTHKLKENDVNLKEAMEHGQIVNKSCVAAAHEKNGNEQLPFGVQEDKERLMEAGEQKVIKLTFRESLEQVANDKEIKLIHKREVIEERNIDALVTKDNDLIFEKAETRAGSRGEVFETKGNANLSRDAVGQEELSGHTVEIEPTEMNGHEREVKWDLDDDVLLEGDQLKLSDGGCKLNEMTKAKVSKKHDNILMLEVTQAAFSSEGNRELKNEANRSIHESEVGKDDTLGNGNLNGFSKNKDELQDRHIHCEKNITMESPCLHNQMTNSNICGSGLRVSCVMPDNKSSELVDGHEPDKIISTEDDGVQKMKTQFINKRVDARANFIPCEVIRESLLSGRKVDSASSVPKHTGDTLYSIENSTSQRVERKDKNMKDNIAGKDQKIEERIRREIELENEHIRKLEEERERVREREKDRMAVNKAALEARERSYIEARERAERAAVERATAEARQRAMTGTRERLEKASMEARLRTERAAVERANAEARQRAAEKSMTQKATSDARDRVENSFPDRFSAVSRPDTRQSTLSSDLQFQSTSISNGLRYSYTSAHVVVEGESPQRCKARLERYRRTAERAASALAEKNRRDLLAQREREERNRVAEVLDAEVRRWSSGKEGNLRALLSTLQYILGPDSGWQPVPLTEVITSAAVKKAYRKATLCVHPDKLQQRGATIQHKYICGKVFDLLKEAWNKFNSEER